MTSTDEPQGNPSFGPLPIELDPESLADAGGESIIHPAGYLVSRAIDGDGSLGQGSRSASRVVDELGGERSMRRRARRARISELGMERSAGEVENTMDDEEEEEEEEEEVGEGSTMDIEDD